MQPAVIEWNELASQSKICFSDLLLIIFWTHPMFSGVYGKIDHVLNGTDHRALEKRSGSSPQGIVAAMADLRRISPQFPIGLVNPHDHRSTFSDIRSGRLVNCQELAFFCLSPIQE
jgi:hypothetical protein